MTRLQVLNGAQRSLVHRHYWMDPTYATIARDVGVSLSAVRQRMLTIHRALAAGLVAAARRGRRPCDSARLPTSVASGRTTGSAAHDHGHQAFRRPPAQCSRRRSLSGHSEELPHRFAFVAAATGPASV